MYVYLMKGKLRPARAFSISEVVVVVVIISALSAVTVPVFSGSIARRKVEAAARRVATDLAFARKRAMQTDTPQSVTFDVANNAYVFEGTKHILKRLSSYDVVLSDEPYGVQMTYASFVGPSQPVNDPTIVFDIYGVPDSGGWVVIDAGPHRWWITLDAATGKAEISRAAPPGTPVVPKETIN
jgi:Tfp pilus assembly protein FimT